MKLNNHVTRIIFLIYCLAVLFVSCNTPSNEKKEITPFTKKDTALPAAKPTADISRPPIINIMDSVAVKRTVLYMKDSAANFELINLKFKAIFGTKLAAVLKKNNLKITGQPMAWYNTTKPPYFFEAGIPIDKKPAKLPANVLIREIGADSVVVAHFYGKYEQIPLAYDALKDWIKGRKKTQKGKPYEVYVDDPFDKDGKMKDPYKVQTDIIFTWK